MKIFLIIMSIHTGALAPVFYQYLDRPQNRYECEQWAAAEKRKIEQNPQPGITKTEIFCGTMYEFAEKYIK